MREGEEEITLLAWSQDGDNKYITVSAEDFDSHIKLDDLIQSVPLRYFCVKNFSLLQNE